MSATLTVQSRVTADAGYHSERNLQQLAAMSIDALIADNDVRPPDERFVTQDQFVVGIPDGWAPQEEAGMVFRERARVIESRIDIGDRQAANTLSPLAAQQHPKVLVSINSRRRRHRRTEGVQSSSAD